MPSAGAADVAVTLEVWPEMIHVWHLFHPRLAAGRRALAGAARAVRAGRTGLFGADRQALAAALLPCGFLLAVLAADLSGMSKAETERIWLPFTLWLPATAAFLPRRDHRAWLAAQAAVALLVNHLLWTHW